MSHSLYTTEGIILKNSDFGEADKLFSFYTKDFGRVDAVAQGARYLKSKLRYSLAGLAFLRLGFVSTSNEFWRLTDAEEIMVLENTKKNFRKLKSAFGLSFLLARLVQGYEADLNLWNNVKELLIFLETHDLNGADFKNYDLFVTLKILVLLGHSDLGKDFKNLSFEEIEDKELLAVSVIKQAFKESHL